ncbi:MAG: DUF1328 domain-containing protein [Bdellovibrionota bacterium]
MLRAAIAFFVLALIAMVFGASGIAGVSMEVGRTLLFVFIVLAVISFIASLLTGRKSGIPGIVLALTAGAAAMSGCSHAEKATDQALATPSATTETAARESGAVSVTEVNFDKGSFVLTEGSRAALRDLVAKAKTTNAIDEVKVLAWADKDYPSDSKAKASKAETTLADKRATAIRDFMKAELAISDVDTHNMTSRPGTFANLFKTDDQKLKQAFENAGVTSADGKAITGKASRAVVMLMPEKQ